MRSRSERKAEIRERIWNRLAEEGIARFPFPPNGRIPNFAGAAEAAALLFELPILAGAKRIKVNPDAPQRPVREGALRRGIVVYMPTPRLRAGFLCFNPAAIPESKFREAASLSRGARWATDVPLDELPQLDALVVGSVAVSRAGGRCGKGEGYADLEYGILRSLGHDPVPVVTTVHEVQIVPDLPREPTDLPLTVIVTPGEVIRVEPVLRPPAGIDWAQLTEADLDAMPVLRELKDLGR